MADESSAAAAYYLDRMRLTLGPPEAAGGEKSAPDTRDEGQTPGHVATEVIGKRFATRLQLLWTYVKEIGGAAQTTSFANLASVLALIRGIARSAKDSSRAEALATFEFSLRFRSKDSTAEKKDFTFKYQLFEPRHYKAIRARTEYHDAALRILHETAIQQLVNSYEQLLADLLREHIAANAAQAAKDQTITYQQLLEFQSLEEAKRHVVETQVTEFVRNRDTQQQFKYLRDNLKIDLGSSFPDLVKYRELVLTRHAIVHAGGIVTSDYVRKLRGIGGSPLPAEGTTLPLSARFITSAWDIVYSLGVVTFHMYWKAAARREHDTEAEDDADNWLNMSAFWAVTQERYAAAERILTYANDLHLAKDTCQLMVLVNLAQTYKWQEKDEKCRALLDTRDWGATNSAFRLCVAVLRGENPEALMIQAVREEQITLDNVYEWPVFQELRRGAGFADLLQKVFGSGASRQAEPFPATLLDLSRKTRLEEIVDYLNRATSVEQKTTRENGTEADKQDGAVH